MINKTNQYHHHHHQQRDQLKNYDNYNHNHQFDNNDDNEFITSSSSAAAAIEETKKFWKNKRFTSSSSSSISSSSSLLQQIIDEPEFIGQIPNITVSIGRDAKFPCIVNNLDTYRIGWIRNEDKSILTIQHQVVTRNSRISLTQSEHKIWTLHIKNVQESDRGGYMCQINTMPMKSQIGYLDVTVPPDFINSETSSDVVVRENQNLTLRCKARGHPEPKLTWRREDNKPIEYGNWQWKKENGFEYPNSTEGESIHIEKISRLHMGAYLCIAQNGVQPSISRRIVLQVNFPPMIWVPNQLVGASIDEQIILQCDTEAFPLSLNYWTKEDRSSQSSSSSSSSIIKDNINSSSSSSSSSSLDHGEIMIVNSDRYRITNQEQSYKVNMKLIIKRTTNDDFGTYRCHAKNSLGSTQGSIRIYEIHRTPSLLSESTSITISSSMKNHKKQEPSTAKIFGLNDSTNHQQHHSMNDGYYSSKFIDQKFSHYYIIILLSTTLVLLIN